jgi:hypothetical protein
MTEQGLQMKTGSLIQCLDILNRKLVERSRSHIVKLHTNVRVNE